MKETKGLKEGRLDHIKDKWQSELDKGVEPKILMDPWAVCEGMKWLGKDGWIRVEEVLIPTEYEEPYPDFYMEIFDQHTCAISHDIYTINEINSYVRNTKARLVNNGIKNLTNEDVEENKMRKNLRERVLDYDTYDEFYKQGCEAYFEGKSLDEVPITGNAWFREAWQEGWKDSKAADDEDVRRAEAEYEDELEWEEAYREDLKESKENLQKKSKKESRRRFYVYDREINKQMDSILSSRGISIKPQTAGQGYALYSIEKPNLQVGELMFTPAAYYLAGPRENIYWEGSTLEEFETDVEDMAYAVREVVKSLNESVSKGFDETELQEAIEKLEEVSKLQKFVVTTMLALGLGTTAAHAIDLNPKEVTAIEQSAKEIEKKADLDDDLSVLSIAIGESLEQIEKIKKGDSDWVRDINPSKTKTKHVLGEKAIKYFQNKLQKEGYDKDIVDAALVLASLTYNFYFDGGTGDLFGKQWKDYRVKNFQEEHPNEKLVGIW